MSSDASIIEVMASRASLTIRGRIWNRNSLQKQRNITTSYFSKWSTSTSRRQGKWSKGWTDSSKNSKNIWNGDCSREVRTWRKGMLRKRSWTSRKVHLKKPLTLLSEISRGRWNQVDFPQFRVLIWKFMKTLDLYICV